MRAVSTSTVDTIKVRIVILPPAAIRTSAARAARVAAGLGKTSIIVDNKKWIPHITLCRFVCEKSVVGDIAMAMQKVARQYKSIPLEVKTYFASKEGGLFWSLKKHPQLKKLREDVFAATTMYNAGGGEYAQLKSSYLPHITLVAFSVATDAEMVKRKLPKINVAFTGPVIALTLSGEYGQVSKILKSFRLKK